ncbi:hypothetical protein BDZ89DRAFT_947703 [Hymenopellis radicata]|nr:hypothetical protein BDZ89DRAFT_947703 [Hymenopellis radicata]
MARIHRALMMLGPWEGRIVAFVLGCGLGVLLRIVYVAILLTYRAITHQSDNQEEEEYLVPPPVVNYQYIDEKQPVLFEVAPDYDEYEEVVEVHRQQDAKN